MASRQFEHPAQRPAAVGVGGSDRADEHRQRMVAAIPFTDDEKAAPENDTVAVERLLERLADVPTPAGPTPRTLDFAPLPVLPSRRQGIGSNRSPGGESVSER